DHKYRPIESDRSLDHIGNIVLADLRVEILDLFPAVFLVILQIEIRPRMDALHFLEADGKIIFDVASGVRIVSQLDVIMKTIFLRRDTQAKMPFHACIFPVFIPFFLRAGADEELHFHLLELPHAEDELPGDDLVAKGLADLRNTKGDLHPARLLYVKKVDKDSLRRFRTQKNFACLFRNATKLGREHEVELPDLGPITCTANA